MDFGKFFKKGSAKAIVISVVCLVVLIVGTGILVNNPDMRPTAHGPISNLTGEEFTEEELQKSDELKTIFEDKKEQTNDIVPPPADSTDEEKENLSLQNLIKIINNINKDKKIIFDDAECQINHINSIKMSYSNELLIDCSVIWKDGDVYFEKDVLQVIKISAPVTDVDNWGIEDLNEYLSNNPDLEIWNRDVYSNNDKLDQEFIECFATQFLKKKNLDELNFEFKDGKFIYRPNTIYDHPSRFVLEFVNQETNDFLLYNISLDLDKGTIEEQLNQLKNGEKIRFGNECIYRGKYTSFSLDKLEIDSESSQSQEEVQEEQAKGDLVTEGEATNMFNNVVSSLLVCS